MTVLAVVRDQATNKIYMAGDRGASDDNTILPYYKYIHFYNNCQV